MTLSGTTSSVKTAPPIYKVAPSFNGLALVLEKDKLKKELILSRLNDTRLEQPINASSSISVPLLLIVILVRPVQYLKACRPIIVTVFGIVIDTSCVQL